jgi:hypothetical protein
VPSVFTRARPDRSVRAVITSIPAPPACPADIPTLAIGGSV